MRISVIAPVLNEVQFIGYSIMAAEPHIHDFVYALDEKSEDGTRELLHYIKETYLHDRLTIIDTPTFHPHDMAAYNGAFNDCIRRMAGEVAFFLHPDMIITEGKRLNKGPQAWVTHMASFAGDMRTIISKGRADKWKNMHAKTFGLHYFGGYGSQNEDFYHSDVTGKSYRHFGMEFSKYPFQVADSGFKINHYCEVKNYARRLEKMKLCLKTLVPQATAPLIEEMAANHPRVSLEPSCSRFGEFKFEPTEAPLPPVFEKYKEFESFIAKEDVWPNPALQSKPLPQTAPISS